MRIALATFGSRGDVQPFIVLGRALVRAGHEVVLCAPRDYEEFVAAHGLPYQAIGQDFQAKLRATEGRLGAMVDLTREAITQQLATLPAAVEGSDLLVATGALVTGPSVAQALRIPYRYLSFCPRLQRSRYHSAPAIPINHAPQWFNRLTWWLNNTVWNMAAREPLDDWRARMGLGLSRDLFHDVVTDSPLLAADPLLAPLPPDLLGTTPQVGAFLMDDPRPLPDDVEAFLQGGEPPVYIGFGSMVDTDPVHTTREVVKAVRSAGVRALLFRGWAGLGGGETLPPEVMAIGSVPHSALLPRVRSMVHHGGAGTTHAAALAAIPQVVIPHFLDQHYWADRVHTLGVSPEPLKRSRLTARYLAESLRWSVQPEARQRARELAVWIRRDGAEQAVEWLTKGLTPRADSRARRGA
ncbi:MAG TPA: glycosyltransferase [Archangium sp.]|jgi:UDP:flavonoid glycosyltransferase YjiC (YdhE family)|uniref:glycosyltransferase n=1 Tax=Archangium sp. TaxID=1872627 RepID=UPI002ED98B0B